MAEVTFEFEAGSDGTITFPATSMTLGSGGGSSRTGKNTMTDGATVTLDWSKPLNVVTLGGNRTLAISGTPVAGESCKLKIIQDATGGRTLTWPTSGVTINWPLSDEPILTTTAARSDIIELTCFDDTVGALVFDVTYMMFNIY